MDPWWGLECDEHCGHGYVGSSCDTAHGEGCGAMTGFVRLRHSTGSTISNRDCPDDHHTCFRGPSACDDGGAWGNACNADIWHCVPGGLGDGSWECNGLGDTLWVHQLSASGVTFAGACGSNCEHVEAQVAERARALGVAAPLKPLTDLLYQAETAALALDKCRVEHRAEAPPQCRDLERRREQLDGAFSRLAGGVTLQEFRSGSALQGPPPAPAPPVRRPE